ncbi:MAG: hypothetical protein QOI74_2907, partial [Micromonosporaceae bacterium]|nr:hypothetical protein [Micromonosporaceae bacterium]
GSPDETWSYGYGFDGITDASLWHHDYNESVQLAYRSWSLWQGYPSVTTTHGTAGGPQTVTQSRYYLGMDGDAKDSTDHQSVVWGARRVSLIRPVGTPGVAAPLVGAGGTCVDISGSNTANGTHVQVWACNGGGAQQWTFNDVSGAFTGLGKCMTISGGGTVAGTPVVLSDCVAGAAGQVWQPRVDGRLFNPGSGLCLDIPFGNTTSGTQLQIQGCGGTAQVFDNQFVDADGLAGTLREQTTYDAGNPVGSTVHLPAVIRTAVRDTPAVGGQDIAAYRALETGTRTRTWIAAISTWRWTAVDTTYDPTYARVVDVTDAGDTATTRDDRCTHTDYVADGGAWLVDYPSQVVTTNCAGTPGDADYLSGTQILYDAGTTVGTAPTKGLATSTNALATVASGARTWKQTSRSGYDAYGRVTAAADGLNRSNQTAYTPTTGGPVTATAVTNSAGWTTTTTLDPGKSLPTSVVDVNGRATTGQYDPLGRLTKVWRANRPTTATPDSQYTYTLADNGPNSVRTQKLGPAGQQIASFVLYDGRLRPRQTQTPAAQAIGGRMVAETTYDNRGLPVKASTFWNNASGPAATLVAASDANVVNQHRFSYDTLQRQTADALYSNNTLKWQTTTAYDGDRSTVTPPTGGIATTNVVDARGRRSVLRQYLNGTPSGSFRDTTYAFDQLDRQISMTDPAGNSWTTTYDLRGRAIRTTDPDKGTITSKYDDADQLLSTTDARNTTLSYSYDPLGRRSAEYQGSVTTGTLLADWAYDPTINGVTFKGQAATATRHVGADTYSSTVTGYDDAYRPLGTTVHIPMTQLGLAGDWTTGTTYNLDGSPATTTYPAAGGLAAETVTATYDNTGLPIGSAGLDTYVADTQYTYWGAVSQQLLGTAPKQVKISNGTDEATGRLTQQTTATQAGGSTWTEQLTQNYTYSPAGQVTSIAETHAGTTVSNQCFSYDGVQQLTEAWTTTDASCQLTPTQSVVGGPDPYWNSYRYDALGDRAQDVQHTAGGNTTNTYAYP